MTPGREVAGVVAGVGPGVDRAREGRRAVAHLSLASGGYAELAVPPAEGLHQVPDGLGADVAVAAIGTGRRAAGILEQAGIGPDDVVLATGAAGGFGGPLRPGRPRGRRGGRGRRGRVGKVAAVRALGADVAVDHCEPGWPERLAEAVNGRGVTPRWTASAASSGGPPLSCWRPAAGSSLSASRAASRPG